MHILRTHKTDLGIGPQDLTGCGAVDPPSNQGTSSGLKGFFLDKQYITSLTDTVGGTILRNESYEELMESFYKKKLI